MRADDDDRRRVVDQLVRHAGEGRLTFTELEDRIAEVYEARFQHELAWALRELPVLPATDRATRRRRVRSDTRGDRSV